MRKLLITAGLALGILAAPTTSSAQTFLTPFAGATFGADAPSEQLSMGAGLTFMGTVAGFELEFGYTPDFFARSPDVVLMSSNNVTSLMANLLLGVGEGPVRPYVAVGTGLLRSQIRSASDLFDDINQNDIGVNAGAGLFVLFTDRVGLRGDVRYFRSLESIDAGDLAVTLGNFDFWRGYVGLALRF